MLIGRKDEMNVLEKFYSKSGFQFIALYGRRRVGKTSLLKEFCKNKTSVFYSAEESTDFVNLRKFSCSIGITLGVEGLENSNWEDAFKTIASIKSSKKIVVVIDEFPYLQNSNKGFMSMLQHLIDHIYFDKNILLIACGSSISFMESEMLSHKSPLFGRQTGQLLVEPFDYYDASKFMNEFSNIMKLEMYSAFGGIPQYLKKINTNNTLKENIISNILDTTEEMFEAPILMIKQELRNPSVYNSIIEVIINGSTKSNEISTKIGIKHSTMQSYLLTLQMLKLISKETPLGGNTKKKTIYKVEEMSFNFVHRFGYPNKSLLEQGLIEYVYEEKVLPNFNHYMGRIFEIISKQFLLRKNSNLELPFVVEHFGTWWGSDPETNKEEEINILGIGNENILYVECKYRNEKTGIKVFNELIRKSMLIKKHNKYYVLISKSGFTDELLETKKRRNDLLLFTIDDLFDFT